MMIAVLFEGFYSQKCFLYKASTVNIHGGIDRQWSVGFFQTQPPLPPTQIDRHLRTLVFPVHKGMMSLIKCFLLGQGHMDMLVSLTPINLVNDFQPQFLALLDVLQPIIKFTSILRSYDFIQNLLTHHQVIYFIHPSNILFHPILATTPKIKQPPPTLKIKKPTHSCKDNSNQYRLQLITIISSMRNRPLTLSLLNNHQYHKDHQYLIATIDSMYKSYHCPSLNTLEDQIAFHEESQYLKRFYQDYEQPNKIILLGEYYQYHQELPRIFQKDICFIIQNYQEDIRNLQYKFVKKKMRDDPETDSLPTSRQKSHRHFDKVIKNIELSYYNFQKKNIKKHKYKEQELKNKQNPLTRNKKSMPLLPFYQYNQKGQVEIKYKQQQKQIIENANKISKPQAKEKSKEPTKKGSANTSFDSNKNLSRTKSKSNIVSIHFDHKKKPLTNPLDRQQFKNINKAKIACGSLQKQQSRKDIHERKPLQDRQIGNMDAQNKKHQSIKRESLKKDGIIDLGMKTMFKKVMQTKKMIKLSK